ncbi:MAG: hypothetical protein AAFV33_11235, partial [Chloroflexota bacterium]
MATISLREYHSNIESWLRQDYTDRVIAHSRHILQYYPKNADTYRYLGQALVLSSQWKEAGKVLRRLLGVFPDDYDAHVGLYQVYSTTGEKEAGLWHLERAFELNPNNTELAGVLRDGYRSIMGVEVKNIPLTAGAAARQFRDSGLFNQAISTLLDALDKDAGREDLRLLLAQTYWQSGRPRDGAEAAFGVLERLPDCFDANRIMTELWLNEERPADATPYLISMEQVDPYLAMEIVSGDTPDDDAFTLEELDYRRVAEQSLIVDSTSFLGDDVVFGEDTINNANDVAGATDFFASEVPDDWMDEVGRMQETGEEQTVTMDSSDTDGILARMTGPLDPSLLGEDEPDEDDLFAFFNESTGFTDELNAAETDEDDPLAFMQESSGLTGMLDGEEQPADADDPLAFMQQRSGLTGMLDDAQPADADDPLAFMQQRSGLTGMLDDEGDLPVDPLSPEGDPSQWTQRPSTSDLPGDDDNDPLAWLRGAGDVELSEGDSGAVFDANAAMAEDVGTFQSTGNTNPLAWLGDDFIAEDAADGDESLLEGDGDSNPLAWLEDEEFASSVQFGEQKTGPLIKPGTDPLYDESEDPNNADDLDWMSTDDSLLDEMLEFDDLTNPGSNTDDLFDPTLPQTDSKDNWMSDYDDIEIAGGDIPVGTDDFAADEAPDWLDDAELDSSEPAADDLEWIESSTDPGTMNLFDEELGELDTADIGGTVMFEDDDSAPDSAGTIMFEDDDSAPDSAGTIMFEDDDDFVDTADLGGTMLFDDDSVPDSAGTIMFEDGDDDFVDTADLGGTMLFDDEPDSIPAPDLFEPQDDPERFKPTGSLGGPFDESINTDELDGDTSILDRDDIPDFGQTVDLGMDDDSDDDLDTLGWADSSSSGSGLTDALGDSDFGQTIDLGMSDDSDDDF